MSWCTTLRLTSLRRARDLCSARRASAATAPPSTGATIHCTSGPPYRPPLAFEVAVSGHAWL